MFIEIEGKNFPFLPSYNIISTESKDKDGEDVLTSTIETGLETKYITKESQDDLVRDAMREDYETFTKALDGKKGNPLAILLWVLAGVGVLVLIVYFALKFMKGA